jgi:hypothetical protein
MKGKLIKCNHFYALQIDNDIIAVSLDKETESHTVNYKYSLSKQNCETITNGYDLDELSKKETRKFLGHDVPENIMLFIAHSKMFQVGFEKAMELNKDKVFSLGQLKTAMDMARVIIDDKYAHSGEEIFQSLQQPTEIEVEVEMDRIPADLAPDGWDVFLKLDAKGCLILKKVL